MNSKQTNRPWLGGAVAAALLSWSVAHLSAASAAPVAGAQDQWEFRGGNAEGHHFSRMTDISEQTVGRLGLAWVSDIPSQDGPVGTPIVANGVSFVIGTKNVVFAHDLATGKLLWTFDPQIHFSVHNMQPNWGARITRGVAYADGKVFESTADCRLIAIDAKTGKQVWQAQVCPADDAYTITSAPRVGGGMVFVGPNNQDWGTRRGFVEAYDAASGKRLWRFTTIPGDPADAKKPYMAMAAKTWDPEYLPHAAGASVWEEITYDPVTGLVFIGVGGAAPWNPADRGKKGGDELFTNSIVALNAKTGDYVWHYQTTPGDAWNLEPVMPNVLTDLTIDGQKHHVLMQAPKNGFFYVLDAKSGKLLNKPQPFSRVNWAKEIDLKTGRPVMNPEAEYWKKPDGALVYPSPIGSHNWNPMSWDPIHQLVYIPTMELPAKMSIDRTVSSFGGQLNLDMLIGADTVKFPLVAWDPVKQTKRWETPGTIRGASGVLSTAGNLVFQGAADGKLRAYRATDGKELWSYDAGGPIFAAPVTVRIGNQQIVLAMTGTAGTSAVARTYPQIYGVRGVDGPPRLLAFVLDGKAHVPARVAAAPFPKPPLPRPSDADAERGRYLFEAKGCDACHGARAQAVPGSVPDLRRSTAETHATLAAIVIGGSRSNKGMPSFAGSVTTEELKKIQALMLKAAWDAYEAQAAKPVRTEAPAPAAGHAHPEKRATSLDPVSLVHPELKEGTLEALKSFDALGPVGRDTLTGWRTALAEFAHPRRDDVSVERRLIAGEGGHQVPVYIVNAKAGGTRPAILHMHGGGFVAGAAEYDVRTLQDMAVALDCTIVGVDYRLAPEHGWRDSLADNFAALAWVDANAAELGIDPARVAVMGESAGGGHAARLALEARDRGLPPLALQVLIYPMLDDRTATSRPVPAHIGTMVWTRESNRFCWEAFLGVPPGGPNVPRDAVPARFADLAGVAPAFIAVGALDLFFEEDVTYATRLNNAGVLTELHVVPGAVHGFDEFSPDSSLVRQFEAARLDALRRAFAKSAVS